MTLRTMKALGKVMFAGLAVFALLQVVRSGISAKPATVELQAPPETSFLLGLAPAWLP